MTLKANLPAKELTSQQLGKNFEDWMKIAADNVNCAKTNSQKINAKNSWNLELIDYFSEIAFFKDGNSINFQKASCTLDGCVKIYTSRVDSVADETGKLLSGLTEGVSDVQEAETETEKVRKRKVKNSNLKGNKTS